jgi:hypothetical protein
MMTLRDFLGDRRDVIARSWLDGALAMYPGDSADVFAREKDPFANPVGHSLRAGTRGIVDIVIDGGDPGEVVEYLRDIMKIRAVQPYPPSQAIGFLFRLKRIVRAVLGDMAQDSRYSEELAELDAQVDGIALTAFDVFIGCREQIYELRVNEVKRQVSWIVEKVNQADPDPELVQITRKRSG